MAVVLVVDDDSQIRDLLSAALTKGGHEVASVASVPEAMAHLRRALPAMVLLDMEMPGEDGYEFIRQVRTPATSNFSSAMNSAVARSGF